MDTEETAPAPERAAVPLTYIRPLKNARGETPAGYTMIARPIVDPIHSDGPSVFATARTSP